MILKLKNKFHCYKNPIFLDDVDIDNIFISKKISTSEKNYKYFIGYTDDHKIKPFSIILPKMSTYIKSYDGGIKWMYFLIEDKELFKNITIFGIKLTIV